MNIKFLWVKLHIAKLYLTENYKETIQSNVFP